MSEAAISHIEVSGGEGGGGGKFLGMDPSSWVKLVIGIIVIVIILQVIGAFKGFGSSPGFQNLADVFDDTTAALAWASSHWYLFLAGWLIAPFVPGAAKWAADKMSAAQKAKLNEGEKKAVSEAIGAASKANEATTQTGDAQRVSEQKSAAQAEKYQDEPAENKDGNAKDFMVKEDIPVTPVPGAVQVNRAMVQAQARQQAFINTYSTPPPPQIVASTALPKSTCGRKK